MTHNEQSVLDRGAQLSRTHLSWLRTAVAAMAAAALSARPALAGGRIAEGLAAGLPAAALAACALLVARQYPARVALLASGRSVVRPSWLITIAVLTSAGALTAGVDSIRIAAGASGDFTAVHAGDGAHERPISAVVGSVSPMCARPTGGWRVPGPAGTIDGMLETMHAHRGALRIAEARAARGSICERSAR